MTMQVITRGAMEAVNGFDEVRDSLFLSLIGPRAVVEMRLAPPFWLLNQREQAKENRSINERKTPHLGKGKSRARSSLAGCSWLAM